MRKPYGSGTRKTRLDEELDPLTSMEMGREDTRSARVKDDDDTNSDVEEDTFCQQVMKRMGITYFLPASYHQDQNKRRIEKMAKKIKKTLKEQKKILELHLKEVNEINMRMLDSKRRLVDAYVRSKGQNDVSTMALKTQMMAVRTELSNAIRKCDVVRAQFDKTARILGVLEIEESLTFGEKAATIFAEHTKNSRDVSIIMNEKSGKQAKLSQYTSGIDTLAELDVIDSDIQHGELPDLESIDRMVDECMDIANKRIGGTSNKSNNVSKTKDPELLIDLENDGLMHVPV